jgi:hypothetical protein
MKRNFIFLLFFLTLNVSGYCGQVSRIELTDGSVVKGEVTSFTNGSYTISTASLGEIKVDAGKIAKIESMESALPNSSFNPGAQLNNLTPSQINSYSQKIMSNPDNAAVVRNLANNPQVRKLAEDPEIINAVKSGNIQALMSSKKFADVVSDPETQEAIKKIKQ